MSVVNSGSTIVELQETEQFLQMLGAQRQLYTEAKTLQTIAAALCLGIPVIITILQIWASDFISLSVSSCIIIELVVFVCGLVIMAQAERKIITAASIQQRFDLALYGLGEYDCADLEESIIKAFKRYGKSDDDPSTLKQWYSSDIATLGEVEAITCCQKTNIRWSFKLGCIWVTTLVLLSVVCVAIVIVPTVALKVDWANLFFAATVIEWAALQIHEGLAYLLRVRDLDKTTRLIDVVNEEGIRRLQDLIFDYRKSAFKVPNWLFRIMRPRYSSIGDEIAAAERL